MNKHKMKRHRNRQQKTTAELTVSKKAANPATSAGRCVSLCAFLVKVANIHFLVVKYILLKKTDVYNFFLAILTSTCFIPMCIFI